MAIAEDKLQSWIEQTMHVAQNAEKSEDLSAIQVLQALQDVLPHLQEEPTVFAGMELVQLSAEMDATIDGLDEGIERLKGVLESRTAEIATIANAALEKYKPL